MEKYRICLMSGDGTGMDIMEPARLVLESLNLDAEYIPADIGWAFWCNEGNALPQQTIDLLKTCK